MAAEQRRMGLRELALGTYDVISAGLAEARTSVATGGRVAGGQRSRHAYRQWVATSASLLQQLLEILVHPASTVDGHSLLKLSTLTPVVDTVGGSISRIREVQTTSQSLASALAFVVPPRAPTLSRTNVLGVAHVAVLVGMGIPALLDSDSLLLLLVGSACVRCRLEPGERRLVLEPEGTTEGANATLATGDDSTTADEMSPPLPSLVPLLRYWISRLHEVVPDIVHFEVEGTDAQGIETLTRARAEQLAAIHRVLNACAMTALLQHIGLSLARLSRCLPASPASRILSTDTSVWLARRLGARACLQVHTSSAALVLADSPPPVLPSSTSARKLAREGGRSHARAGWVLGTGGGITAPGIYAVRVGTGEQPVPLGRDSPLSSQDMARIMLSLGEDDQVDALLAAIPSQDTTANAEADARAYDARTLRSVSSGVALRPLPAALRRLLAWLANKSGSDEAPAEEGTQASGPGVSAGSGNGGTAIGMQSTSSFAAHAVHAAIAHVAHADYLSTDYAALTIGMQSAGNGRTEEGDSALMRPLCALHRAPVLLPLASAANTVLSAARVCRLAADSEACKFALQLLKARPDCESALRLASARVKFDETDACLRISFASRVGSVALCVGVNTDGGIGITCVGSAAIPSSLPEHMMPTTVLHAVKGLAEEASYKLARRREAIERLLCRRHVVEAAGTFDTAGLLPGFLLDTSAAAVASFSDGMGSPVGLASAAFNHGSVSLLSVLLSASDAATPVSPSVTAGEAGRFSLLGSSLEAGTDTLLAAALSFRARHDAELLAILSNSSDVSVGHIGRTAIALLGAFAAPQRAMAALTEALAPPPSGAGGGDISPSGSTAAACALTEVLALVKLGCNSVRNPPSAIYAALQGAQGIAGLSGPKIANVPGSLLLTQQAVSRKLLAVQAVALAEAVSAVSVVVSRLLPVQTAAAAVAATPGLTFRSATGSSSHAPVFVQRWSGRESFLPLLLPWATLPLSHRNTSTLLLPLPLSLWLRLGLSLESEEEGGQSLSAELTLCCRHLQHGTCCVLAEQGVTGSASGTPALSGGGVSSGAQAQATIPVHGMSALTVTVCEVGTESAPIILTGLARWADSSFLSSLADVTGDGCATDLRVPKAALEQAPGFSFAHCIVVVECPEGILAGLCQPNAAALSNLLYGRTCSLDAVKTVHGLIAALATVGGSRAATCVVLVPPAGRGGLLPSVQEDFIPTVQVRIGGGRTPVLWCAGPAGSSIRRAATAALPIVPDETKTSSMLSSAKGPGNVKASMFRSGAVQPLRMGSSGSAGGPSASSPLTLRLASWASCARMQICLASCAVDMPRVNTSVTSQERGDSKRRRVEAAKPPSLELAGLSSLAGLDECTTLGSAHSVSLPAALNHAHSAVEWVRTELPPGQ